MQAASIIQLLGSGGLGFVIGWYLYYIHRYRRSDVRISDLLTLVGAIGGGAATALFPAKTDLFGAYGIGLFAGFFSYFLVLIILVATSKNFNADWFLDGRRKKPEDPFVIPDGAEQIIRPMGGEGR